MGCAFGVAVNNEQIGRVEAKSGIDSANEAFAGGRQFVLMRERWIDFGDAGIATKRMNQDGEQGGIEGAVRDQSQTNFHGSATCSKEKSKVV